MQNYKNNLYDTKFSVEADGQRFDNFCLAVFRKLPKNAVYRLIRLGRIQVNNQLAGPNYRLKKKDCVQFIKLQITNQKKQNFKIFYKNRNLLQRHIVYEDEYMIAINKPAGIAVHQSHKSLGVIDYLRYYAPDGAFLQLVHRLDKKTSGVLLIAKTLQVLKHLQKQFCEKKIFKIYFAVLNGLLPYNFNKLLIPIKKMKCSREKLTCINYQGKICSTNLQAIKYLKSSTLAQAIISTGKTHQIRLSSAYFGYPLACDYTYASKINLKNGFSHKTDSFFLHAAAIKILHPIKRKKILIQAPLN